jgi:hypothetical protein
VKRVAKLILGTSCVGLLLLLPGRAVAAGGHYSIDGGTVAERGQVRTALEASTFAWAYWPSAQNAFNPAQASGESWLHPATLRALLGHLVGVADPSARVLGSATARKRP